ncbi:MAG: hypothetical protein CMI54_04160 [Parcubacteria group bacterium]|jgi:hypothetical protein|nr:hypothetical protein [Parcubacteria group bacterium]|tara:strand:+ start:2233 stop:2595 length:363 start_codon:yes stop_codon:yes gene_type:complete
MAHEGIFATSDEILVKAGENYDTDITEARINALCVQAESTINSFTRFNWSDAYAGLNVDVKGILSEAASNLVAIYIISYNFGSYNSRREGESMINVLRDGLNRALSQLRDMKVRDFMNDA